MRKLETRELSKSYRGRKVVDDVSIEVEQGEVVGLLGPNGAGKTTSFYMIVGLITPDSGKVLLDEPFSGIDPIQVLELQRIIFELKRSGIGILVTDHNVRETLMVTDRAYIINNGKIFRAGSPDALGRDPEVRRVYLGESFSLRGESIAPLTH